MLVMNGILYQNMCTSAGAGKLVVIDGAIIPNIDRPVETNIVKFDTGAGIISLPLYRPEDVAHQHLRLDVDGSTTRCFDLIKDPDSGNPQSSRIRLKMAATWDGSLDYTEIKKL